MHPRVHQLLALLRDALRWWLDELHATGQWLGIIRARRSDLRVEFQPERVCVYLREGDSWTTLADEVFDAGRFPVSVPPLEAHAGRRCEVLIPRTRVLVRHLELPASMEADLRSALGLQIDRLMPYEPDWIYFDYEIQDRDRPHGRMALDLAIVERRYADPVDEVVRQWGLIPTRIAVASEDGSSLRFDFRPPERSTSVPATLGRWTPATIAAALVLSLAVAFAWTSRERDRLDAELAQVRADTRGVRELQGRLQTQLARAQFLADRMRRPGVAAVVAELKRTLPDNAWIYELQLRDRRLQLAGLAGNASELSPPLERSPLFEQVTLRQATRSRPSDAAEQFQLDATIVQAVK